jgi:hypothetical protein
MADSTQGEARNNGRGSGRHARARAAALALPGPSNADATSQAPPATFAEARAVIARVLAAIAGAHAAIVGAQAAAIAPAREASAHARVYQHAMAYARIRAYISLAVKGSGLLAFFLSSVILLGGFIESLDKLGKKDFWCVTAITVIQAAGSVISPIFLYLRSLQVL